MSDRELFLEFQQKWTKEKVQNMTLEEYTGLGGAKSNRDDFTYWIEFKLENLGKYSGYSHNRGIYAYNKKPTQTGVLFDEKYAWYKRYGSTAQEAFEFIKDEILKIIEFSQNNELEKIDTIFELGIAYIWKIAFHYQNIDDMKILDIFKEEAVRELYKNEFDLELKNVSEFHRKILTSNEKFTLEQVLNKAMYYNKKYPKLFSKNIFWAVGFTWDKTNKFDDFLKNNIWEYGWGDEKDNKLLKEIKKDDIFVMKSSSTKGSNHDMPFTRIKAIGIVKERIDSYVFKVDWLKVEEKDFDGIVYRKTIEKIRDDEMFRYVKNLINKQLNNANGENDMEKSLCDQNSNKPLNQILYGPPGTGKTYETINLALQILGENVSSDRKENKDKFDKYRQNGQIEFITFHQSYGYEDFIEGIKPVFADDSGQANELKYKIEKGIFRKICEKANENLENSKKTIEQINLEIDLENSWNEYIAYLNEKISNGENMPIKENSKMKIINATEQTISISSGESNSYQGLSKTMFMRDYIKFKNHEIKSYKDIKPYYESKAISHGNAIYYYELFKQISEFEKSLKIENKEIVKETEKRYILIIDEINRGNISKIFGELITLIEESKRVGNDEELKVRLPYSGESFGVPRNLYIIGTMNTADRSIALLDTALRRRFEFVETMPNAGHLKDKNIYGVDLQKLLKAINERIEYLLDREHTIGHAYFIGVNDLNDLKKRFQNKIIPLLQEYFYDDYEKIRAVLNDNGMILEKSKPKFATEFEINDDKKVYQICNFKSLKSENFQKIYDDSINLDEKITNE